MVSDGHLYVTERTWSVTHCHAYCSWHPSIAECLFLHCHCFVQ